MCVGAQGATGAQGVTGPQALNIATNKTTVVYISSRGGSDTTGDGSLGNPYYSIGQAITAILANGDLSVTWNYTVKMYPGDYAFGGSTLPPNVGLESMIRGRDTVRITDALAYDQTRWTTASASTLNQIVLRGIHFYTATLAILNLSPFNTLTGIIGGNWGTKTPTVVIEDCSFPNYQVVMWIPAGTPATLSITNTVGYYLQVVPGGGLVTLKDNIFTNMDVSAHDGRPPLLAGANGGLSPATVPNACTIYGGFYNTTSFFGSLVVSIYHMSSSYHFCKSGTAGGTPSISLTRESVPAFVSVVPDNFPPGNNAGYRCTHSYTYATSIGYTPTTPGQWSTVPTTMTDALDFMRADFTTGASLIAYTPAISSQWNPVPTTSAGALDQLQSVRYTATTNRTRVVYVGVGGSDTTGTGSVGSPFFSIGQAIANILSNGDLSVSWNYTIKMYPGVYAFNGAVIPPNIGFESVNRGRGTVRIVDAPAYDQLRWTSGTLRNQLVFRGIDFYCSSLTVLNLSPWNITTFQSPPTSWGSRAAQIVIEDCSFPNYQIVLWIIGPASTVTLINTVGSYLQVAGNGAVTITNCIFTTLDSQDATAGGGVPLLVPGTPGGSLATADAGIGIKIVITGGVYNTTNFYFGVTALIYETTCAYHFCYHFGPSVAPAISITRANVPQYVQPLLSDLLPQTIGPYACNYTYLTSTGYFPNNPNQWSTIPYTQSSALDVMRNDYAAGAALVVYSPTTPGNWPSSVPTTTAGALDAIQLNVAVTGKLAYTPAQSTQWPLPVPANISYAMDVVRKDFAAGAANLVFSPQNPTQWAPHPVPQTVANGLDFMRADIGLTGYLIYNAGQTGQWPLPVPTNISFAMDVVQNSIQTQNLPYTPAVAGNWAFGGLGSVAAPTTVTTALDQGVAISHASQQYADWKMFGNGMDGNLVCSSVQAVWTRAVAFVNVTVTTGCIISTGGYPMQVSDTLDITSAPTASIISYSALSGAASAGGASTAGGACATCASGVATSYGGSCIQDSQTSCTGRAGGVATNTRTTIANVFQGGYTGPGGAGGGATYTMTDTLPVPSAPLYITRPTIAATIPIISSGTISQQPVFGGVVGMGGLGGTGAGGSGSGGGGGGGAGGTVIISAKNIFRDSTTTNVGAITAKGSPGGTATSPTSAGVRGCGGGGGGGGGGFVLITVRNLRGTAKNNCINVSGGNGGVSNAGVNGGLSGTGGGGGMGGVVQIFNVGAGTQTVTRGVAGTPASVTTAGAIGESVLVQL